MPWTTLKNTADVSFTPSPQPWVWRRAPGVDGNLMPQCITSSLSHTVLGVWGFLLSSRPAERVVCGKICSQYNQNRNSHIAPNLFRTVSPFLVTPVTQDRSLAVILDFSLLTPHNQAVARSPPLHSPCIGLCISLSLPLPGPVNILLPWVLKDALCFHS